MRVLGVFFMVIGTKTHEFCLSFEVETFLQIAYFYDDFSSIVVWLVFIFVATSSLLVLSILDSKIVKPFNRVNCGVMATQHYA
jgi:hypothetical protein